MPTIVENQTVQNEIVLSERVVTNEFRILEIQESVQKRYVRVEVELGPFVKETLPNGEEEIRGSGRRGVIAWENEGYDAVRDTWRNEDLLVRVKQVING